MTQLGKGVEMVCDFGLQGLEHYMLGQMPLSNCTIESVVLQPVHSLVAGHGHCDVVCALRPAGQPGSSLSSASPSLIIAATVVSFQHFSSNSSKMALGTFLLLALRCVIVLECTIWEHLKHKQSAVTFLREQLE